MSQEKIHEKDFSDMELPPAAHIDLLLSDIESQLKAIYLAKMNEDREILTIKLAAYIRGYRDGHRLGKPNPFPDTD